MQRLHARTAKGSVTHDADIWMRQVHCLYYRTCSTDSGYLLVVMVEPTQYRSSNHLAPCTMRGMRRSARVRKLLLNTLMRSCAVEVRYIQIEYALELLLAVDQQVVEAFLSHTPGEAFTDRIGSRCVIWCSKNLNRTRCRHTSEAGPKFTIGITEQIPRCLPIGRGFSQLLRDPGIGRGSCDADMDHTPCPEFDEEEREERSKEEISHLQEVTGPDMFGVIVQERRPILPSWSWCTNSSHVFLNGALAHMNTEFQ
jgi:hypothetical protein